MSTIIDAPRSGVTTILGGAAFLSISRVKLYALIRDREVDSLKIGRSRRVTWASLHAYVARQVAQFAPIYRLKAAERETFTAAWPNLSLHRLQQAEFSDLLAERPRPPELHLIFLQKLRDVVDIGRRLLFGVEQSLPAAFPVES